MSSRAAGGRKRLGTAPAPAKSPKPVKSGGLFSRNRSKSTAEVDKLYPSPPQTSVNLPHPNLKYHQGHTNRPATAGNHHNHYQSEHDPFRAHAGRDAPNYPIPNPPPQRALPSGYDPRYPEEPRYISEHISRQRLISLNSSNLSSANQANYHSQPIYAEPYSEPTEPTFLEASYQPPPPSLRKQTAPGSVPTRPPQPPTRVRHQVERKELTEVPTYASHPVGPRQGYPQGYPQQQHQHNNAVPRSRSPPSASLLLEPTRQAQTSYNNSPEYTSPRSPPRPVRHQPSAPNLVSSHSHYGDSNGNMHKKTQLVTPISAYPSPPLSNPGFAPSPLMVKGSPPMSMLSLPLDSGQLFQESHYGSFYSSPVSSPPSARTDSSLLSPSSFTATTRSSVPSSSASQWSSDSQQSNEPSSTVHSPVATGGSPAAFVFPGSRSMARPKGPKTEGQRGKISKKSRLFAKNQDEPGDPITLSPISSNGSSLAIRDRSVPVKSDAPIPFVRQSASPLAGSQISMDSPSNGGASTRSVNSSANSGPYVFPSSRSRATPSPATSAFEFKSEVKKRFQKDAEKEVGEKTRFMGFKIKKKKKQTNGTTSRNSDDVSETRSTSDKSSSRNGNETHGQPKQEHIKTIKSRVGSYPLDAYDSVLLDNDRQTGDLLRRLNTTSPSFHEYRNNPPSTVLDLGCGQGHWVLDAAIAWKGYGTKVTGFDIVDTSKNLWPWAVKQGVIDNIRFVKGNFLKQALPFQDNSFDFVRMSCLALCIPTESWEFVLREACRVLIVGGRLEIIDDHIFFPYGKSPSLPNSPAQPISKLELPIPMLDVAIPSSTFSIFNVGDGTSINPGLGASQDDEEGFDGEFYDLYGVDEGPDGGEFDDNATLSGSNALALADPIIKPRSKSRSRTPLAFPMPPSTVSLATWNQQVATARDLEALFEHMLTHKFGINMHPSEFLLSILTHIFGHARQLHSMRITLAPPDVATEIKEHYGKSEVLYNASNGTRARRQGHLNFQGDNKQPTSPSSKKTNPLSRSPGLLLCPSTFIPMPQEELEIHASKHLRVLLSCKSLLVEHATEATQDEDIDEDSVLEAIWEYEGFLRQRFNPPANADTSLLEQPHDSSPKKTRNSVISVASEARDAMWEYQTDFREHFGWSEDRTANDDTQSKSPSTVKRNGMHFSTPQPSHTNSPVSSPKIPTKPAPGRISGSSQYTANDLTHVRTFYVYEATKMSDGTISTI